MDNWYLYRHIRLDKHEPFYIGIGKVDNFKRAYSLKSRNKIWKSITQKTNYEVEVIFDNLSKEDCVKKEKSQKIRLSSAMVSNRKVILPE